MKGRFGWLLSLVAMVGLTACADEGGDAVPGDEIGSIVPAGKADDFFSVSAQEYYVDGTTTITLEASWADATLEEREAEVRRLIPFKQVVIGWFLNVYMVDKHDAPNEQYGGFKALTKNGSYEDLELTQVDDLTWTFNFRQELGGQEDLIRALPDAVAQTDGSWTFALAIGKIGTAEMQQLDTDKEWYRKSPWSKFDPATVDASKQETLTLTIRPEPASDDAWIDVNRLFADGKLTIGIHYGWDYHKAYHEVHSEAVYDWLVAKGFDSPVDGWADLAHDAGPLTGTTTFNGKSIDVEVSLFWGRKGDATDPDTAAGGKQLEADMLESLADREVVIFSGHSGPFYGFALANWRKTSEGDLDDSELTAVPLNTGVYQLIVAEGCDTYALGQAFYDNPHKDGLEDLDIITTTSFSNASTAAAVTDVLSALIGSRYDDEVTAKKYSELLRDLDQNSYWFTTMYGIHGIDDNPTVHPLADVTRACAECARNEDCGGGMRCVAMSDGAKACAALCTASTGCGAGFQCRNVQTSGYLRDKVCAPESLSCAAPVDEPTVLVINEIVPNPDGDYNADGTTSATADEYVEIVNRSPTVVDLAGWSLSDGVGVRHVFATGTELPPGGAILVFGGGDPQLVAGTTLIQTASTGRLGLNNSGDSVHLADVDGHEISVARYGAGVGAGEAVQRSSDGDPDATFVTATPTPGTASDGSQF